MDSKIERNLTLTGIVRWLNDNYEVKGTCKPFTYSDVQQYITIGHIPMYLGGYRIEKVENEYAKLYNIIIEE